MKITKIIVFFLLCCLLISVASGFPVFAENETPEWKAVYTGYIDNILAEDTKNYILMSRYLLYDIDGNGIPELVISSGRTDADTKTLFFTCEDGQLVPLGELPTGFVVFDADDANDRMLMFRNLDEERVYRQITVKSNQVAEEVLSPDEVQEIEASFRYLRMAGPDNLLPLLRYEEICNYLRGIFPASESVYFPENNETFFEEIVADKRSVLDIPEAMADYPYHKCKFSILKSSVNEVTDMIYSDLNGDGQLECVIDVRGKGAPSRIILSEQDGEVYAYVHTFAYETVSADSNGNLITNTDGVEQLSRVIFDKENWLIIPLPLALASRPDNS